MMHWTTALANVPDSVRQQLRNIARQTGEDMQVVLTRYATERLMYRLSCSEYCTEFVLKGAWLFYLWEIRRRTTRDVDFLASVDRTKVERVFRDIIEVDVPHDDGLTFHPETIRLDEIQEDGDYAGLRIRMIVKLGRTRIHTQVDLGFNEALAEEPVSVELPVLLDYPPPEIQAYNPETVIAEKVEAIVKLGTINTRFKDFFDIYVLSGERSFDAAMLQEQIIATFSHRGTELSPGIPGGLGDEFSRSREGQEQWTAFVRRSDAEGAPDEFVDVVDRIRTFLMPVLESVARGRQMDGTWRPLEGWT